MTNLEVINNFLQKRSAKTNLRTSMYGKTVRTLHTEETNLGFSLYNYNIIIAFILDNKLHLNVNKYSATTSKIQSQLRNSAKATHYEVIEFETLNMGGGVRV